MNTFETMLRAVLDWGDLLIRYLLKWLRQPAAWIVILLAAALIAVLIAGSQFFSLGIVANLLVSQLILLLPTCVSIFWNKKDIRISDLGFRKIKIST